MSKRGIDSVSISTDLLKISHHIIVNHTLVIRSGPAAVLEKQAWEEIWKSWVLSYLHTIANFVAKM